MIYLPDVHKAGTARAGSLAGGNIYIDENLIAPGGDVVLLAVIFLNEHHLGVQAGLAAPDAPDIADREIRVVVERRKKLIQLVIERRLKQGVQLINHTDRDS